MILIVVNAVVLTVGTEAECNEKACCCYQRENHLIPIQNRPTPSRGLLSRRESKSEYQPDNDLCDYGCF